MEKHTQMQELVAIDTIHPDPANVRKHPEKNIGVIKASLARFGQQKPIVVDALGIVRAGNGTWTAAKELGWKEIKIVRTELVGAEATAYSIADNRSSELAEWSINDLNVQWLSLADDLKAVSGLTASDLAELLSTVEKVEDGLIDPDDVPLPPDAAVTKPGDLWILGNHRLLCGDSSKPEAVDRLLEGARIQLVNTDPPYNVKVEPRSNNAVATGLHDTLPQMNHQGFDLARHPEKSKPTHAKMRPKDRVLANDFLTDEAFDTCLDAWFGNISRVLDPGRGFYIWGGYTNCANYPAVLKKHELYFSQAIIWDKQWPVLGRKDFMGAHEWAFYGWREGAAHKFFGPNNATDLWHVKKMNQTQTVHLTEKPVELAVRAMQYSSLKGENVLDLFGGSGSTLIAAEQTGRKAFLMELDDLYCDVIINRWEKFTGKKAEKGK
jgi:DNA modification methylase